MAFASLCQRLITVIAFDASRNRRNGYGALMHLAFVENK
jgi:hypothetical protein